MNTQAQNANALGLDALKDTIRTIAREKGRGRDGQVRTYMNVVEAAYHGCIDTIKDKHGQGRDDAVMLAELYVQEQAGVVMFDAKLDTHQKTASCFRACIKVGSKTALGPGEPLAGMGELLNIRRKIIAKGGNKRVDDAANTLLRWARAQQKANVPFSTAELEQIVLKKNPDIKSGEDILNDVRKKLLKLRKGDNNGAHDESPEVVEAISNLTKRLTNIAKERAEERDNNNLGGGLPTTPSTV